MDVLAIKTEAVPGKPSHRLGQERYPASNERLTYTPESKQEVGLWSPSSQGLLLLIALHLPPSKVHQQH